MNKLAEVMENSEMPFHVFDFSCGVSHYLNPGFGNMKIISSVPSVVCLGDGVLLPGVVCFHTAYRGKCLALPGVNFIPCRIIKAGNDLQDQVHFFLFSQQWHPNQSNPGHAALLLAAMALVSGYLDMWGFVHPLNPRFLPIQFCCADWLSPISFSWWWDSGTAASHFLWLCWCKSHQPRMWKCLCESHSHAGLGQSCCHLSVSLFVSWIFWAWKYLFKWWLSQPIGF